MAIVMRMVKHRFDSSLVIRFSFIDVKVVILHQDSYLFFKDLDDVIQIFYLPLIIIVIA